MKPFELERLLRGELPWSFLPELLFRLALVYLLLMTALRLMGKRMAKQATRNELAALVSMAGAIGPSIADPERGLLPTALAATVFLGVQRLVARVSRESAHVETITQGRQTVLVRDGAFELESLEQIVLPTARVASELRAMGVLNLGEVDRFYLEVNGEFTLVKSPSPRPGLSLVPIWDDEMRAEEEVAAGVHACAMCGSVEEEKRNRCTRCGSVAWLRATAPPQ